MTHSPDLSFTWTIANWEEEIILKRLKDCEIKGVCFWCGERKNLNYEDEETELLK